MNDLPLVSVSITTYNHEKYIEQCIRSVISQNVNFKYEIIVGNDASTDKTLEICQKLQNEIGRIIKIINHKKNIGLRQNNKSVWTTCKGKYIAYLEGDDFWTSDNKLQSLVNFLEKNEEYSAAYHQVQLMHNESSKDFLMPNSSIEKDLSFIQNLAKWEVGTCSLVYRNFFIDEKHINLTKKFLAEEIFWSDRPLMAFISFLGPFKYIPQCMGVWRQHETNMTKIGNLISMYSAGGLAYKKMYPIFPKYKIQLSEQVIRWYLKASREAFRNKKYSVALKLCFKAFINIKSTIGLKNFIHATILIFSNKEVYT